MSKTKASNYTASITFETFRYQLLVDKTLPINMFGNYDTEEKIRTSKNEIFQNIITGKEFHFKGATSELTSKFLYSKDSMLYFKLGIKRTATVYTKELEPKSVTTYPNLLIAINNDPDVQKIAIQNNASAFREIHTVNNIVMETLDNELRNYNLSFYTEPIYDEKEFWKLVKKYPKQITQLKFDLISPNMANLTKDLQLNLKQLYNETNTHRTKLELNADDDSYLEVKEDSRFINSLVNYSAAGGGNIALKVQGKRKLLHTAESPDEFTIDKSLLEGDIDWEKLNEKFKNILI